MTRKVLLAKTESCYLCRYSFGAIENAHCHHQRHRQQNPSCHSCYWRVCLQTLSYLSVELQVTPVLPRMLLLCALLFCFFFFCGTESVNLLKYELWKRTYGCLQQAGYLRQHHTARMMMRAGAKSRSGNNQDRLYLILVVGDVEEGTTETPHNHSHTTFTISFTASHTSPQRHARSCEEEVSTRIGWRFSLEVVPVRPTILAEMLSFLRGQSFYYHKCDRIIGFRF